VRECDEEEVRAALDLDDSVPVVLCDVRRRESGKQLLLALLESARSRAGRLAVTGN
jgi:hypothetical protein